MAKASTTRHAPPTAPPIIVEKVETRRAKFLRLGQGRMENCLHDIRLLGNLASPTYEWTEHDVAQMYATLQSAIEDTFARFKKETRVKLEETFKLGAAEHEHETSS